MNQLRDLREKAGLKQKDVGTKLRVSQGVISQWERGCCFPKTELLPKLAIIYNCTIDELINPEKKPDIA